MTITEEMAEFVADLRDRDIPALVVFMDDGHWRLAGQRLWKDYAAALRTLADQCDRMADGQRLN